MNYKSLIFDLNKIGIALSSTKNLDELLNLIVSSIIDLSNCDACSLYIREYNPDRLIFRATKTVSLESKKGNKSRSQFMAFPVPLKRQSVSGYTALTGKSVNIGDCYKADSSSDFRIDKKYDEMNNYKTISMLAVPMKLQNGKIIGVLQLINKFSADRKIIPFPKELESIVQSLASQAGVAIDNVNLLEANKALYKALVKSFSEAIEARSPHTAGHTKRVAYICNLLAHKVTEQTIGKFADIVFTRQQLEELHYAALLHDIGKISVPERILEKKNKLTEDRMEAVINRFDNIKYAFLRDLNNIKLDKNLILFKIKEIDKDLEFIKKINIPGFVSDENIEVLEKISSKTYKNYKNEELKYITDYEFQNLRVKRGNFTAEEYTKMKSHVIQTSEILKPIPFTEDLAGIPKFAGSHHEFINGTGYPHKLKGEAIPIQARIMTISDIFEALTATDRPYKKGIPVDKSLMILEDMKKHNQLDQDLVDLFIKEDLYSDYLCARDENRIEINL